jgi:hypothetical protein
MTERKDVIVKVKGISLFGENKAKPKEKDNEQSINSDDKKGSTEKKESTHGKT